MTPKNVSIDLIGKHLKSVPDSILENKDITTLNLGSSKMVFYPPLSALVDSNANEISELPNDIGTLKNLKVLKVSSNRLTRLPESIIKLTCLEDLDLSINKELDIVRELDKLKQLPKLKVLKIVDTKVRTQDLQLIKASLKPGTRIIATISEYMRNLEVR